MSQIQNGEEVVIAYGSKAFSKTQEAYCTTRRELLAVVMFVEHFRYYLWGRHFLIRTDHASLTWLVNFREPEGILARWLTILFTYDFEIMHRAGVKHGNCDGLSRKPRRLCPRPECGDCNEDVVNDVSCKAITEMNTGSDGDSEVGHIVDRWSSERIKNAQGDDPDLAKIIELLRGERPAKVAMLGESRRVKLLVLQWGMLVMREGVL